MISFLYLIVLLTISTLCTCLPRMLPLITGDMAERIALKDAGIVPDLVSKCFYPQAYLVVKYGDELVTLGNKFTTNATAKAPEVVFLPVDEEKGGFTLLMLDLDVPSTSNHSLSPFNHWTVVNIPGGEQTKVNDPSTQLLNYFRPGSSGHRYVFLLYQQRNQYQVFQPLPSSGRDRLHFDYKTFADTNHLKLIGVNFFYSSADAS